MGYVCVRGYSYRPPPENPRIEVAELQYLAHPYHDRQWARHGGVLRADSGCSHTQGRGANDSGPEQLRKNPLAPTSWRG
jgi:hypothetical protein